MIDFSRLVMAPNRTLFGRPVVITPLASQTGDALAVPPVPAGLPYPARGIWGSKPADVDFQGESTGSTQVPTLGIRAADFAIALIQGDQIEVPEHRSLPREGVFLVEDGDDDGQGGTVLALRKIAP